MNWLHKNNYNVLPLTTIVAKLKANSKLPNKTVGISFDDAYKTIYSNALPILKKYNFHFTLFISPKYIPSSSTTASSYMSWPLINKIPKALITLANHAYSHHHMISLTAKEIRNEIVKANNIIINKTGVKPTLFAYPYGEYSKKIINIVKEIGFAAAFSQTSGSNDNHSNLYTLQRFPINNSYYSIKRFNMITQTKALNLTRNIPATVVIKNQNPKIQFTLHTRSISNLNCYPSSGGTVRLIKNKKNQYTINLAQSFKTGRNKINCTAKDMHRNIYWRGLFFYIKKHNPEKTHDS